MMKSLVTVALSILLTAACAQAASYVALSDIPMNSPVGFGSFSIYSPATYSSLQTNWPGSGLEWGVTCWTPHGWWFTTQIVHGGQKLTNSPTMDLDEIYVQIESKLVDPPEFGSPGTMELRVLSLDAENGTGITNVPVDFAVWHTSRFAVADMWVPTNAAGVTQKAFDPAAPQYQIILRMDGAAQSWAMPTPNTAPPSISNNFQIGVRNYKLEGLVPEPFAGGALVLVLAVLAWRRS